MEPSELSRRFSPKVLNKQIRGQRLLPTEDRRSFEFVYSFGGFSGAEFRTPGEGLAWIKSTDLDAFYWEVRKQDLDGNYSEVEEIR